MLFRSTFPRVIERFPDIRLKQYTQRGKASWIKRRDPVQLVGGNHHNVSRFHNMPLIPDAQLKAAADNVLDFRLLMT